MGELAENLQQFANAYIDHPIVDATGLQGWTPKGMLQAAKAPNPNQPAGAVGEASDPDGLSVFEAVEKEARTQAGEKKAIHPSDRCGSCG